MASILMKSRSKRNIYALTRDTVKLRVFEKLTELQQIEEMQTYQSFNKVFAPSWREVTRIKRSSLCVSDMKQTTKFHAHISLLIYTKYEELSNQRCTNCNYKLKRWVFAETKWTCAPEWL